MTVTKMEDVFYSDGLDFSCKQCSFCCCGFSGVVLLSEYDLERLAQWADVTAEQFTAMYCRWMEDDQGKKYLSLRERQNNECIFWDKGCSAYEARPTQFRTYPFCTSVLKDRESWQKESLDCPGINTGNHHSKEEITEQLELYQSRKPITK